MVDLIQNIFFLLKLLISILEKILSKNFKSAEPSFLLGVPTHINIMSVVNESDSTNSTLIKKLKGQAGTQMPKNKDPLEQLIITLIATWIQEGAQDN